MSDWKTRNINENEIDALYDFGEPDTYVPYDEVDNGPFLVAWISLIVLLVFVIGFIVILIGRGAW